MIKLQAESAQEAFDKVVAHFRTNPGQCTTGYINMYTCQYRFMGNRCAIGVLIADLDYRSTLEGRGVQTLIENGDIERPHWDTMDFLMDLQRLHDEKDHWGYDPETDACTMFVGWDAVDYFANEYGLVFTP